VRPAATATTRGLVAFAALLTILVACGAGAAAEPCWKQVQSDWSDNTRIDGIYPAECYDKAIAKLPPDLLYYSDAPDTILAAKQGVLRDQNRTPQSRDPDGTGSENSRDGGSSGNNNGDSDSPLGEFLNWGPSAADDVPLPLLIVAFLALLLMAAGAAGLVNRHLQARRAGTPPDGPAPA
jgi:hypothetical protein